MQHAGFVRLLGALALSFATLLTACGALAIPHAAATMEIPAQTPPALAISPAKPLVWTRRQLPTGLRLTQGNWYGPALAASNGDVAYLCDLGDASTLIWTTTDRAAHWQQIGGVPRDPRVTDCFLIVDQLRPERLILRTYVPDGQCCGTYTGKIESYLSADGGATWATLAPPSNETPIYSAFATLGGVTFAAARTRPHSACFSCYTALSMSTDGMRTWSRVDGSIFDVASGEAERFVTGFSVSTSGELLATVQDKVGGTRSELWHSDDQGSHWAPLQQDHTSGTLGAAYYAPAEGSRFWWACITSTTGGSVTHPPSEQLSCTLDGGQTWLSTGGNTYKMGIFAQATDGAVLAVSGNPMHGEPASTLLRITPGQTGWESLGALPSNGLPSYAAGTSGGVLWQVARPADYGDPFTIVFTATYP